MSRHFTQIFWGLLLVFVDLRFNGIDVLPDIVGYILVAVGCRGLEPLSRRFTAAGRITWTLAVLWVVALAIPAPSPQAWTLFETPLHCILIWQLLGGILELAERAGRFDLARLGQNRRIAYVGLSLAAILIGPIVPASGPLALCLGLLLLALAVASLLVLHLVYRVRSELRSGGLAFLPAIEPLAEGRSPWQFSLRTLVVALTLAAVGCTYWVSYLPHDATAKVQYKALAVQKAVLDRILNTQHPVNRAGSNYAWVVLEDPDVRQLTNPPSRQLGANSWNVSMWPRQAASDVHVSIRNFSIPQPSGPPQTVLTNEDGSFNGFLGVRRIGREYQFRVQCKADYRGPAEDPPSTTQAASTEISGDLDYEGPVPRGHLVFFAPVGPNLSHVVILDVDAR